MPVATRGVGIGGRRGNLRWTPSLEAIAQGFKDLREPIVDECFGQMELLRLEIQEYARENAPWGINRNDAFAEEGEIHEETGRARRGLFAFKQRQKSGFVVGLTHSPRTVERGFPYGIALETFEYQHRLVDTKAFNVPEGTTELHIEQTAGEGTYAIINPTLQHFYSGVMDRLDGALSDAVRGSRVGTGSRKAKIFNRA